MEAFAVGKFWTSYSHYIKSFVVLSIFVCDFSFYLKVHVKFSQCKLFPSLIC